MDTPEAIEKKIRKAKTDSIEGLYYDEGARPEVSNLIRIYSEVANKSINSIEKLYQGSSVSVFKKDLSEILIQELTPISSMMLELQNNRDFIEDILTEGQSRAFDVAEKNLNEIKKTYGLII